MVLMGGNAGLDELVHIAKRSPVYTPDFLGFAGGVNTTKANLIARRRFRTTGAIVVKGSYKNLL